MHSVRRVALKDSQLRAAIPQLIVLVLGISGYGEAQTIHADYVLDLLTYVEPAAGDTGVGDQRATRTVVSGGGGVASGDGVPELSVFVTLVSMDRMTYEVGDEFVYEVLITNAGEEPVQLPWSPDPLAFKAALTKQFPTEARAVIPGFQRATLFVDVRDSTGRLHRVVNATPLYGGSGVAGSLQALSPGESALVRVPSRWVFLASSDTSPLTSVDVSPVTVRLFYKGYRPIISRNSLPITLRTRR